ncbi:MAG: carboxypeptidase-like regulatory domain-containing protein [Acidimicrobiales bacterium]
MARLSRIISMTLGLSLLAAACGDGPSAGDVAGGDVDPTTTSAASPTSTAAPAADSGPTTTTTTIPPLPEPAFAAIASPDPGVACVGTRLGLSCLIDGTWENFDSDNSPIYSWVQSVDVCADGTVVAVTLDGIATYADGRWTEIPADFSVTGPEAVACGADAIWAGFFGSIAVVRDGTWTSWDSEEVLGTTDFVKSVKDVAVAPDGTAWVVTGSSIARFDGAWTAWEDNAGFDVSLSPTAIDVDVAADGSYTVHAAAGFRGIANFVDGAWTLQETSLNGARDLAAADGEVLIPAFRNGVVSYRGAAQTPFTSADGLSSDTVRGVAIDDLGQQWFATEYGLTVVTEDDVRTYRVDNSGLLDNDTWAVAVSGAGPDLPGDEPREWSGLAGLVLDDVGTPYAGITVEVCVEEQDDEFEGDTPCADDPFMATTSTDETGRFEVVGLRPGRYTIAMQTDEGWTYFIDGSVAARYDAPSGTIAELGVFTITE